jgi:hypothetical protein
MILSVLSLFSTGAFLACTVTTIYFAFMENYGASAGFGLLSCVWFGLMIAFGYAYLLIDSKSKL